MTASEVQASSAPTKKTIVSDKPMDSELLQDLLEAALNLARIDESIADATAAAPSVDETGAQKWHDVSLRALSWTRAALASKQDSALKQMLEMAKLRCKASVLPPGLDEIQLQAKTESKPLPPSLSVDAPPFCPGPPGVWIMPNTDTKASSLTPEDPTSTAAEAFAAAGLPGIGSLREDLIRLRDYDADCCLIVRRIKHLGLSSAELLRDYFERFGKVSEVLVSHSFEKKSAKCRCDRIRPAALGFIVMENAKGALSAISAGPTLEISKVQINVKQFEAFEDDNGNDEEVTK